MSQSGSVLLSGSQASGTSGTFGPTAMGSNIIADISCIMTNGGTPPTTPAYIVIKYSVVSGGAQHSFTIQGPEGAGETIEVNNLPLPATIYEYEIDWYSGDDQAVTMQISKGLFAP